MVSPLPKPLDFLFIGLTIGGLIVLFIQLVLEAVDRRRGPPSSGGE